MIVLINPDHPLNERRVVVEKLVQFDKAYVRPIDERTEPVLVDRSWLLTIERILLAVALNTELIDSVRASAIRRMYHHSVKHPVLGEKLLIERFEELAKRMDFSVRE